MDTPSFDTLLKRNREYTKTHVPPPSVAQLQSFGSPGRVQNVIITCCDPRLHPNEFLQLNRDDASIIRTAGGRAVDAVRSLVVLEGMVPIKNVAVVHHSDCGLTHQTDDAIRARVGRLGATESAGLNKDGFGYIKDHKAALMEDVSLIKDSPYIPKETAVEGYLLDIQSGALERMA